MNAVKDKLPALVAEELVAANLENPPFHSTHEGYAVLLEEVEETKDAMNDVEVCLDMLWEYTKKNFPKKAHEYAERIEKHAMHLAAEALQVAAMAKKFQNMEV